MISHYRSITVLLLSTLALQVTSIPWDNQASSSSSSSLNNHEQSRLVSLRPRSSLGSSAINAMRLGNDPSNTNLLDTNKLTLTIMGGNPLARHSETGETFAPGIAHLATGVSEMHEDKLTGKGVRIGIIDTGVDYRHPALGGDNPATRRVKFGHNFVDNEIINGKLQPPEDPMDCAGHGTMVAGIIGAITNTYTGVAPDAILGAYKVFGCKPGPTVIKLIVDAIDTAYRHGMDIVNMSFGLEPKEVELLVQAMQEYSRLDMIFIAAVPNYKKGDITGWNADLPGILPSTISVGGMDVPYEVLSSFYLYYDEYQEEPTYKLACGSKRPYSGMFSGIVAKSAGSRRLCDVPDNARGNIVIVPNECNTGQFISKLYRSGAIAIIMSSSQNHLSTCTIPVIKIDSDVMSTMRRLSAEQKPIEIMFAGSKKMVPRRDRIVGTKLSAWGPTIDLRLSPEITAPGKNVVTKLHGGYGISEGTSGAVPYLAGMTALYFEHCDKNGKTRPNYSQLRSLLQNNAIPYMVPGKNLAGSVAHQGAGMAHIDRMIKSTFSVWPSAIELLDIKQRPTSMYTKSGSITINNLSNSRQTFYLRHIPAVSMRAFHANGKATEEIVTTDVHIEASITGPQVITLKPRDKASIPITFTIPVDLNYAEHWLYSGYIVIDTEAPVNGRPPSDHAVYVPYLGLNGNIQTIHKFFEIRSHSFQR